MSSLITIKNNKLMYNLKNTIEDVTSPVKIISVIGKARTGKSTLMNLLISKWSYVNTTIFKMSDSGDHCTNGVDYYYVKEYNIILLDFQGIYLGDSSQDSKLLLLAYLLSDVIIFNENKMLSNNTLSQFEPMLSFIQYMHKDDFKKSNPKLIFRITDVNLNIDATTNMHQMLTHQDDQFQSIRDCINELFDEPFAINTNNLDRSEFKLLKNEDFMGILNETENGFDNAITKINEYLSCCTTQRTVGSFCNDIRRIVMDINSQKKIDFTKLDVVLNLANYEILDYINNVDNAMYSEIIVDGTQNTYEKNLIMRITKRDDIIKDIYKKFKKIPKNIIDTQIPKFTDKVNPLIEKATKDNLEMAQTKLSEIINSTFGELNPKKTYKTSYVFGFGDLDNFDDININYDKFMTGLETIFTQITKESHILFKDVFEDYIKHINNVFDTIKTEFFKVKDMINWSINNCKCNMNKFIEDTITNIFHIILDTYDIETHTKIESYYTSIIKEKSSEIQENILKSDNYENKQITFNVTINIDNFSVTTKSNKNKTTSSYFTEINEKYITIFKEQIKTKEDAIIKMLSDKREEILTEEKGKIGTNGNLELIIKNNPQVIFVEYVLNENTYTMTQKYFDQTLKKDFTEITKVCIKESYQNDWSKFMKEITNIKIEDKTKVFVIDFNDYKQKCKSNYRKLVLLELFELEFKKYFARNKFIFEF
jgi:hypothetical protein